MAKAFAVRARSPDAAPQTAPETRVVMRLVDYGFSTSARLTAGRQWIRVQNVGAEPHEVSLIKLAPGKTMQDFEQWIQSAQGPPPANSAGGISSRVVTLSSRSLRALTSTRPSNDPTALL